MQKVAEGRQNDALDMPKRPLLRVAADSGEWTVGCAPRFNFFPCGGCTPPAGNKEMRCGLVDKVGHCTSM